MPSERRQDGQTHFFKERTSLGAISVSMRQRLHEDPPGVHSSSQEGEHPPTYLASIAKTSDNRGLQYFGCLYNLMPLSSLFEPIVQIITIGMRP